MVPLCRFYRAMDLHSTMGSLLFFLGLWGICTGSEQGNCTNYKTQFERVFSVPGDVAMLNSTLVSPDVFNFTRDPYYITWYDTNTGREMTDQDGRILVRGNTLWFLNVTLEDNGEYVAILRTPTRCYRQATELVVDLPIAGDCEKPKKAYQSLAKGITDILSCPLKDYMNKLESYNIAFSIQWYRGCDPIVHGTDRYNYIDKNKLKIDRVQLADNGTYTCTLTFTLGGVTGSVSETIDVWIAEEYSLVPEVHEPANEIIKAEIGSNFSKRCLVFVPCVGKPLVDISWFEKEGNIWNFFRTSLSNRIYISKKSRRSHNGPREGMWLERTLIISKVTEKDFNKNYTCIATSDRGHPQAYFTLLPAEPNILLPIGTVLGGAMLLFIIDVTIFYLFKVDIVLWFRRAFPVFYKNLDLDGKLYDAYVAYPPPCAVGYSKEVETFACHTLPEVLEKACGYKLFIASRDCLPGQAVVDSVEENLQASRCLLLLYTASTFTSKRHTSSTSSTSSNDNNNISKSSNSSFDGCAEIYQDTRQQLECVAAMHRALLEGYLKVILVELEEITPAQLALFPESVRHLRKKQGAVCWWKTLRSRRRWRPCVRRKEDEEKSGQDTKLSPSLSPSTRFWKEMRYHMPVRGNRTVYPEKTALLNL